MIDPDHYSGKYAPWGKFDRPQLGVPPPTTMPKVQSAKTFGGPISFTPEERRMEIAPGVECDLRQINYLAPETNWEKFNPRLRLPTAQVEDISEMSRDDFHRYRNIKDLDGDRVPRVPNIQAYEPSSAALPHFNLFGTLRDHLYYTHHPEYRNIRKFPLSKDAGYFGYRHELLDRHNTGEFWKSRRH